MSGSLKARGPEINIRHNLCKIYEVCGPSIVIVVVVVTVVVMVGTVMTVTTAVEKDVVGRVMIDVIVPDGAVTVVVTDSVTVDCTNISELV